MRSIYKTNGCVLHRLPRAPRHDVTVSYSSLGDWTNGLRVYVIGLGFDRPQNTRLDTAAETGNKATWYGSDA